MKPITNKKTIVSACLLGIRCRYDGKHNHLNTLEAYLHDKIVIPVCPEVLGGLPIPRNACECLLDRVIDKDGSDFTEAFYQGALKVLEIAQREKVQCAILKSRSPSCGYQQIYDGSFSHKLIAKNGICANMLIENGIRIINSDFFEK